MAKEAGFWNDMWDRGKEVFNVASLGTVPAATNALGTLAGGGTFGEAAGSAWEGFKDTFGQGEESIKARNSRNSNIDPRAAAASANFRAKQQAKTQPKLNNSQYGNWNNPIQTRSPYDTSNNYFGRHVNY
jgi:hypothetical protein